jgi:hypothetical protein
LKTDPFEARRIGAHRLRVVTASISAAAVVGTGALAWSVAAGTASASTGQSSSDDGSTGTSGSDDSFVPSPTLPQTSIPGNAHASSGGS